MLLCSISLLSGSPNETTLTHTQVESQATEDVGRISNWTCVFFKRHACGHSVTYKSFVDKARS